MPARVATELRLCAGAAVDVVDIAFLPVAILHRRRRHLHEQSVRLWPAVSRLVVFVGEPYRRCTLRGVRRLLRRLRSRLVPIEPIGRCRWRRWLGGAHIALTARRSLHSTAAVAASKASYPPPLHRRLNLPKCHGMSALPVPSSCFSLVCFSQASSCAFRIVCVALSCVSP